MKLRLKKKPDGSPVLTCVRPDGSSTSGRLGAGDFGAVHDLAHYAVEATLGLRAGFYGLLATGWNIPDFEIKGAAARLPDEAIVTECIVGQLTTSALNGEPVTLADFNWLVRQAVAGVRPGVSAPDIDAAAYRAMGECYATLLARWRTLPPGETIELDFPTG